MAAASNESFGLKIATAFSIALSVVLLISVYFLNSNYNAEFEKRAAAEKKASDSANTREAAGVHPQDTTVVSADRERRRWQSLRAGHYSWTTNTELGQPTDALVIYTDDDAQTWTKSSSQALCRATRVVAIQNV